MGGYTDDRLDIVFYAMLKELGSTVNHGHQVPVLLAHQPL